MAADGSAIVHTVGSKVWIKEEKEAWIKGEVIKVEDDFLVVKAEASGAEVKCKSEDAPLQNPHNNRGVDVSGLSISWECNRRRRRGLCEGTNACCTIFFFGDAGHDDALLSARARCAVELEHALCVR